MISSVYGNVMFFFTTTVPFVYLYLDNSFTGYAYFIFFFFVHCNNRRWGTNWVNYLLILHCQTKEMKFKNRGVMIPVWLDNFSYGMN